MIPPPSARVLTRRLLAWFRAGARDLPWRRTLDPYAIWISEIMLQQTQVKTVIPYYDRWMKVLPDITALANVSPERLHKLWEGLGYYTRVRNLQQAARLVVAQHGGKVPLEFDALLELPGIGRYTAGAISSIAFNQPQPIVDGNVVRVLARLFAIRGNPKDRRVNDRFWSLATSLVEAAHALKPITVPSGSPLKLAGNCSALNQALMELGATVCTPTTPRCAACPLRRCCSAHQSNRVRRYPGTARRPRATGRRFIAFVIRRGDRVLIRQRPAGVVNAHLWEFPNAEIAPDGTNVRAAGEKAIGMATCDVRSLGVIKHSITRYRISTECFAATLRGRPPRDAGCWRPVDQLAQLAFTAAHQRLLARAVPESSGSSIAAVNSRTPAR